MDLQNGIKPITYMKTQSAKLIEEVNRTRSPIVITQNGEARAVVQDVASYEETRKALLILKLVAQGENDYHNGRILTPSQVSTRARKILKKHEQTRKA